MTTPVTPVKKRSLEEEVSSPGAPGALRFNFWKEQRQPKIVKLDLSSSEGVSTSTVKKIKDLAVTNSELGLLEVKVLSILSTEAVVKALLHDGENDIEICAFGNSIPKLLESVKLDSWIQISNIMVKPGNPGKLQLVVAAKSVIKSIEDRDNPVLYSCVSLAFALKKPVSSLLDLMVVIVYDWGIAVGATGNRRLTLSVTDKSEETMRLTIWGPAIDQLVDKKGATLLLRKVKSSVYEGVICLQTHWCTTFKVNPQTEEAKELSVWFTEALETCELKNDGEEDKTIH